VLAIPEPPVPVYAAGKPVERFVETADVRKSNGAPASPKTRAHSRSPERSIASSSTRPSARCAEPPRRATEDEATEKQATTAE
jgi:hypothetical protein